MEDRLIAQELSLDLKSWVPAHVGLYEASKGSVDETIALGLELYSTYFAAVVILPALRLRAVQAVSDGKNSLERFTGIDWDALRAEMLAKLAQYKQVVSQAAALADQADIATPQLFTIVGLGVDPVTGV